jgi:hypothetical protein
VLSLLISMPSPRIGHWSILEVPAQLRVNAIHAALLHTGKVLIIAGSGNSSHYFAAGNVKTLLWDPETNQFQLIPTPDNFFCAGHTLLPDGKLLRSPESTTRPQTPVGQRRRPRWGATITARHCCFPTVASSPSAPSGGGQDDSAPGGFEQRIEVYSPPYLYRGPRPVLIEGPTVWTCCSSPTTQAHPRRAAGFKCHSQDRPAAPAASKNSNS